MGQYAWITRQLYGRYIGLDNGYNMVIIWVRHETRGYNGKEGHDTSKEKSDLTKKYNLNGIYT